MCSVNIAQLRLWEDWVLCFPPYVPGDVMMSEPPKPATTVSHTLGHFLKISRSVLECRTSLSLGHGGGESHHLPKCWSMLRSSQGGLCLGAGLG